MMAPLLLMERMASQLLITVAVVVVSADMRADDDDNDDVDRIEDERVGVSIGAGSAMAGPCTGSGDDDFHSPILCATPRAWVTSDTDNDGDDDGSGDDG